MAEIYPLAAYYLLKLVRQNLCVSKSFPFAIDLWGLILDKKQLQTPIFSARNVQQKALADVDRKKSWDFAISICA